MSRDELSRASELVEQAGGNTDGEPAERLAGFADQLETLATRERGPDHGRLARILTALEEIQADVDDETAETIAEARDAITEYRKGVSGV